MGKIRKIRKSGQVLRSFIAYIGIMLSGALFGLSVRAGFEFEERRGGGGSDRKGDICGLTEMERFCDFWNMGILSGPPLFCGAWGETKWMEF